MLNEMNQELFERIEAYLMGRMSDAEQKSFESELMRDPSLAEEVKLQRQNMLAVELGAMTESLKDISGRYEKEHPSIKKSKGSKFNSGYWGLGLAAGMALLLGLFFLLREPANPHHDMVMALNKPDVGLPVPMSSSVDYVFYDAMVDYKAGKFQKALEKWKVLSNEAPQNDTLNFYIACAYQGIEKFQESQSYLEKVMSLPQSKFKEKALWRSCLAAFALKEKVAFMSLEEQIHDQFAKDYQALKDNF